MIRKFQNEGHLVAMTGDGTNDGSGLGPGGRGRRHELWYPSRQGSRQHGGFDSSPTKCIEIVRIGKQLLMTRGSLTTFSIANDIAKYFAIIPAIFMTLYPGLAVLNIMRLGQPFQRYPLRAHL